MNRREFIRATLASGLVTGLGCESVPDLGTLLPSRESPEGEGSLGTLLARFAHITDTHIVDDESPARFPAAQIVTRSAWRPYEAYSNHILDGILRTVNRIHASGRNVNFLIHTGDGTDNAQSNELESLLSLFDGRLIDPLSGPDDRPVDSRPPATMDPYAAFQSAGLYRNGAHGGLPSIPWYALMGNHDSFATGLFPFFDGPFGRRTAPLPLQPRPGIVLPTEFDPAGFLAHGNVTPNEPGPPAVFQTARFLEPNPARRFYSKADFVRALFQTLTTPAGHGMTSDDGPSWFSVSPAPGVRLIGLDSSDPGHRIPAMIYVSAAVSAAQAEFLRSELAAAQARDEVIIVATHHPSASLEAGLGSALTPETFRSLLGEHSNVVLHICGHKHRNRVTDRGSYLEIETCSTIDLPQEGRLIEIRRDETSGEVSIAYEMFSHLNDELPALGDDPVVGLRQEARSIAMNDAGALIRQRIFDESGKDPRGRDEDRRGRSRETSIA